jgi:hypothetical protein
MCMLSTPTTTTTTSTYYPPVEKIPDAGVCTIKIKNESIEIINQMRYSTKINTSIFPCILSSRISIIRF